MKYQIRKGCFETNSSSMHSLIITKENENVRMTQEEIRDEFYLNNKWYKRRHKDDEKEIVEIRPWDNDFGRSPFTVLTSFEDKLAYAIAEYCGNNYGIKSYVKSEQIFNDVFEPLLINLIGCDEIKYGKTDYRRFEIYSDVSGEYLDEVEQVPYDNLIYIEKEDRDNISDDELVSGHYKNISKDNRPIEEAWFDVPDFGTIDHQSSGLLKGFLRDINLSLEDYLVRKDIVVVIDGDEYDELGNLIECGLIKEGSIVLRFPKSMSFDCYKYNEENNDEETD